MPRSSTTTHYGPAEVLYAAADSLMKAEPGSPRALQLQEMIEQFIREDHLRQLLLNSGVRIARQDNDTAMISLVDTALSIDERNDKLNHLVVAFRGVI